MSGIACIKPQFIWVKEDTFQNESLAADNCVSTTTSVEPQAKKLKTDDCDELGSNGNKSDTKEKAEKTEKFSENESKRSQRKRGQNRAKDRPLPKKAPAEDKLCPFLLDGTQTSECPYLPGCPFMHDVGEYIAKKPEDIKKDCYMFKTYGKCPRGVTCRFSSSHVQDGKNIVNDDLWNKQKSLFDQSHNVLLPKQKQIELRKHKYDFKHTEKVCSQLQGGSNANGSTESKLGPVSDEDSVPLRVCEIKKIDWQDKLYLSPLTTVGNLPFRRLCVEFGADVTCSEMSLATSLLQGNTHEFALHRRHPSEKLWGVQLCASSGIVAAKAAQVLHDCEIPFDFIDLNMGCPLDAIYRQGAGSGLMCRNNKFHTMVKSMVAVLGGYRKPFTVKMRKGVTMDKNIAHNLIAYCRDAGVSLVTLHGRSREQRYLKTADWNYIGECVKLAAPMPVFGNGDILSWEEYNEKKAISNAPGVMIGRGALMKPWIFQEIKEQRHIDMNSTQRMEILQKYVNYGLDHWGSDDQGIATTRRFLLEFLSFYHRYIPYGILEEPPQKINQRPPRYIGRDEMETMLASSNAADWIKISEMFLGQVPSDFVFVPKHKANAW